MSSGLRWTGQERIQSQTLAGELPLRLHIPAKILGFASRLRLHVDKPEGFRIVVFSVLAGCRSTIDLGSDTQGHERVLDIQCESVTGWKMRKGWQDPPPYRLAVQSFMTRSSGRGNPIVLVESLTVQALTT